MRRRYQVNLYTEHSKHLDLIEHLMSFDKNKRSSELTMLLLAGYQVLYGKADTGVDRSTSMLIDEQERLLSLLMARRNEPNVRGPDPVPGSNESQPVREKTGISENSSTNHSQKMPNEAPQADKKEIKSDRSEASDNKSTDKPAEKTAVKESTKRYESSDLTDEDPSIDEIPEQDLEEDVVDPLSLLG